VELIGVGIDLVDIVRVERMMAQHGERVLARFLTEREQGYVAGRHRPAMHIAARIAAKEAAYKALQALPGARDVGWQHLEVERETEGRPTLILLGPARELAERFGPLRIELSLSHSEMTAGAVAVLIKDGQAIPTSG
jgi:holo-[acyl-carrier protein] synthase